jgi:gamma-glutamyltranspeptidase / glutathione hydrolase
VKRRTLAGIVIALALSGAACGRAPALFPPAWPYPAEARPVTAASAMVVTTDDYASEVGLEVLRRGGNAIDAAVAVHFALAVVNPAAGNIGGGGFLVARLADGELVSLDFREKAPLAATRDMFLDAEGRLTDRSTLGHLASGVPGSVMGMWEAHRRFGTRPWAELLRPAVELARGFQVGARYHNWLNGGIERELALFPASRAQFLPRDGSPPLVGDTLRQLDLSATLARIRDQGADGFYAGETADLIVAEMARGGGIITHEDLAAYRAVWREPVTFSYRGHTVVSMPPSSSGGATLAEIAHILERWDLRALGFQTVETIHLYAEAWKRAYADRNQYLADPDYVDVPLERMTSREYADERASTISLTVATPSSRVAPGLAPARAEGPNTTHYSILDEHGNAVAVTTTINSWYGSKVTVTGAGFLLNNEMDDFSALPGAPNQFGLVQGEQNAIEPGKRMLSAMTPTIVLARDGSVRMITGTPGGSTIITTVFQTISNVLDFGMGVVQAVNAPRAHHQHLPDEIVYERSGLDDETVAALEALGHTVRERGGTSGDVQMIVVERSVITGWADPRRGGLAIGY